MADTAEKKTSGRYEVAVNQWGSLPNHQYLKGQRLEIEDIASFPYDVEYAEANGVLIDLDKRDAEMAEEAETMVIRSTPPEGTEVVTADSGTGPSAAPKVTKATQAKD